MSCSQEKEGPTEKKSQSPVQSEREALLVGTLTRILHILYLLFFTYELLSTSSNYIQASTHIVCFSMDTHDVLRLSPDFPCQWVCFKCFKQTVFYNRSSNDLIWRQKCLYQFQMAALISWPTSGCMPLPPSSLSKNFGAFRQSGCNISVLYFELKTAEQHHHHYDSQLPSILPVCTPKAAAIHLV